MFFFGFLFQTFAHQCPSVDIVGQHPIRSQYLDEISGASFQSDDAIWVHNDSGDKSVLYRMNHKGEVVQKLQLPNVKARDWEDIAMVVKKEITTIYIGDIGDNKEVHPNYPIHVVTLKKNSEKQEELYQIESLKTIYIDYGKLGSRDAEGLAVDPNNEDIYILTKGRGGKAYLLRKKAPHVSGEYFSMEHIYEFEIPVIKGLNPYRFTALDISKDGDSIVWRDYQSAFLIRKSNEELWEDVFLSHNAITHQVCPLSLPIQPQGESIAFGIDSNFLWTISEKEYQPLYFLQLKNPLHEER